MKRILNIFFALGVGLTPVTVPLITQPSWGQTQNSQAEEAKRLLEQAEQQRQQGHPQQAIQTLQQVLAIARALKDRELEAIALLGLGLNYKNISQGQQALDYYNQALPIFREVGNRSREATTLNNIGVVYNAIGQPQKALEYYNQTLTLRREVGDAGGEATTLNNIGSVYNAIGQPQKGLEYFNQALAILREVGDAGGEATTLNNIGGVYYNIGQPQKALEYFNQALPIRKQVGDLSGEATTLNSIGFVYQNIGQPQKALEYFNQALPIRKQVGDRAGEATTLNNIGGVFANIGQPQKALNYYNQALPILQEVGFRSGEASTLNNIGGVYRSIGQLQKALEYFNQALPINRKVGDRSGEATTLNNIGEIYQDIRQPQKALEYFNQALPILKEVGNRLVEATTLHNIGGVYRVIRQPQKALEYFNQALPIFREVGDRSGEATTLNNIGWVYYMIEQRQKALEYCNQALSIFREVGDAEMEAITLSNIGFVYRNTNRPTEAITNYEESVNITLEMRRGLQRQNRLQFLQDEEESATALVDLLIDQKQYDKAYEWVNRATTADLADYTRLINAKVADQQAQQAINEWNQKNQQLELLRQQLQNNFSEALSRQIRELEAQVNQQAEDISRRFPDVAELFETTVTDIEKLKSSIPAGTVVVQPILLTNVTEVPDTIAIFVLTKDQLSVIKTPIDPTEFEQILTQYLKQVQDDSDANYIETGGKLYDILIRPVEDKIQAFSPKQLSIITTGKLRYLPFETLYDSKTDKFLIQKYPVNYLTRISTRSLQQNVERKASVLALGNPVPVKPYALDGAEEEVNRITQTLPGSQPYIRNQATLDAFKTQAPRFHFLHLATHGCFQPEGCCLDASTCHKPDKVDLQPNTILFANQQFFNIADAALLGLNNTELLTLSACQTAQETTSNEEGIAGVAYIFERAGAKAVIASLWSTEDKATEQLMIQFYENLKQGMSKGEALRQAKLKQIDRHPFYWSPFILIGDAR